MSERRFEVSDPRPGDTGPLIMPEDEFRKTNAYLVDVIDQESFRQGVVIANGTRLEVSEIFETLNQHEMPQ